jgi:hypothetical protein
MPQKKHKPEEIVAKLRQVDVLVSQGQSVAEAVRSIGVTQFTYYRWCKEYGGLKTNQVKRLKELETPSYIQLGTSPPAAAPPKKKGPSGPHPAAIKFALARFLDHPRREHVDLAVLSD